MHCGFKHTYYWKKGFKKPPGVLVLKKSYLVGFIRLDADINLNGSNFNENTFKSLLNIILWYTLDVLLGNLDHPSRIQLCDLNRSISLTERHQDLKLYNLKSPKYFKPFKYGPESKMNPINPLIKKLRGQDLAGFRWIKALLQLYNLDNHLINKDKISINFEIFFVLIMEK
ncbi:hypothetical protein BpHYR1_021678 [Brachionus plicatilis]|uniref:Uncharacterized protein n=1 Tax=Brachionus plicatilis TaxID=10195 RepID=A0A3M7RUN2_BRAPC|nr:hypothetical protein BpHYR1_021678 [Brachionus plicatilis]